MLSDNQLVKLPLSIAKLSRLRNLNLADNVIKTLPHELSHMHVFTEFQ